ncbi:sugar ABC transporter ATP-binding protein [Paenibacillus sp. MAH-36]|uniref:Sugar ABC transporter ATP-binding protein n=1 Tax=Paenibacillus violae TaxID=3077234 RepID=A0ABU3RKK8_9BACL|nr:sugar ABC transporter ATP-binding protein [Paenibacillus sp. PFR10]MDU0204788.1 sugar ABC transporter ATP-binding protein [Paenibacillus sp. PFR10]
MTNSLWLELDAITKQYPGVKALDQVSLQVRRGEVHAIVGENGAGKSTLIKVLAGVIQPDQGRIMIEGKEVVIQSPTQARKLGITVIYQDLSLFPNLTVAENIALGESDEQSTSFISWKKMTIKAQAALDRLGIELDLNTKLSELSVGKQQLVAIARALVSDCKLLIMDEPTSSLSRMEVGYLFQAAMGLKRDGIAIVFIGHKFDEIYRLCDTATVLRDGQYITSGSLKDFTQEALVEFMVGRKLTNLYHKIPVQIGDILLQVNELTKAGQFENISFRVRAGEIVGITGLVGAGRSELAESIFGLNPPDQGSVSMKGVRIDLKSVSACIHSGLALVPESRQIQGLAMKLSMQHNTTLSIMQRITRSRWFLKPKDERSITEDYIQKLSIRPPYPHIQVDKLSGGNQQKVVLAKWIATNPSILILDEPTNGVDIGAKAEIYKVVNEMVQKGIGVILISSELPEILSMSDRILVMCEGKLAGELDARHTTQAAVMKLAVPGINREEDESNDEVVTA